MTSILLGSHHQPRTSPRQAPHARTGRTTGVSRHQADLEEERPPVQRTSSAIIEEDSELGDSWAVRADAGEDAGRRGEDVPTAGDGIMALVKQFTNVQTRGRGINI
jgi:autophagy-related protein 9